MTQTLKVGDTLHGKLRDEVSADLKGYVTVEVKNKKTGEIEHQENHNLIVYGGREWLLRRLFGKSLPNNEYATNSCIKWVGFGCGGGEAGNPLQAGTTLGQDTDLYQPCRIRFEDDSVTSASNGMYASRILPNGSVIPGYYKKISNITIKEDHANPYIENNIRKYPKIIAEIRIELSSDDCNGQNYTENGNLVAYQDINEVGLFISDADIKDPGRSDRGGDIYLDIIQSGDFSSDNVYTDKIYHPANIVTNLTKSSNVFSASNIAYNCWSLQYRSSDNENWITVSKDKTGLNLENNSTFEATLTGGKLTFKVNGTSKTIGDWGTPISTPIDKLELRLISLGIYDLKFKNAVTNNTDKNDVICTLQYRNYSNESWTNIANYTFPGNGSVDSFSHKISCECKPFENVNVLTNFRVRQTINGNSEIKILSTELDATSYDIKCYVSETDIKKVKVNNFVFTENDTESTNYIPESAPLNVIEVYDPEIENPTTSSVHQPYFVIERQSSSDHTYASGLTAWTYTPSNKDPYTLFSRVTLSSIRKTVDREIILIWKIYC